MNEYFAMTVIRILRYICLVVLTTAVIPSQAQKGFYIGFAGNVNASLILNQNTYGVKWNLPVNRDFELAYDATLGFGGNAKFGYNFKEQIGLEWHAGYQAMGMNYFDEDQNMVVHDKSISLDYVTIAMAFRYTSIFKKNRYKREQKVRLAIVAGPQFGILTRASLNYTLESEFLGLTFDDDGVNYPFAFNLYNETFYTTPVSNDRDFFSTIDAGILFQVGIDIYPKPWFYIAPVITSYIGLTDINASAFRQHSGYAATRNAFIGLNLGMGFYINQ